MELSHISHIRLANQQINGARFKTAREVVGWMGAMQAQDFNMVKWAVGVRLPGATINTVDDAFNSGDILRTHLLRPTWHLVASDDIRWMLHLTAPRIKTSLRSRHKELELTEAIVAKSNDAMVRALEDRHLTREELVGVLTGIRIPTDENRASHLLLRAELEGLICSGAGRDGKYTYALLDSRATSIGALHREEALALLARRYFLSHGPATLQDFAWWSGLSATDARNGLESIRCELVSETVGEDLFWFASSFAPPVLANDKAFLIPAFDEFIISYRSRNASMSEVNLPKAVSNNGIFRPVIVTNGQVSGLWKRTVKGNKVMMEMKLFRHHNKEELQWVAGAAESFGHFLEKEVILQ
ncbi:MAG TPA: winged helix DNA-binding domain-containing protein [Williamwhitmania sp.]|nr:winged helix DNA-binding domain-containing protein [Williamwhitmania sp.]